jgi:hypothetical protein
MRLNVNPFEFLAHAVLNDIECGVCRGSKKTPYFVGAGAKRRIEQRVCESCHGTGMEVITPALRVEAASRLGKYLKPELKSVVHSGSVGGAMPSITIEYVNGPVMLVERPGSSPSAPAVNGHAAGAMIDMSAMIEATEEGHDS